jgi:hypothetical protein
MTPSVKAPWHGLYCGPGDDAAPSCLRHHTPRRKGHGVAEVYSSSLGWKFLSPNNHCLMRDNGLLPQRLDARKEGLDRPVERFLLLKQDLSSLDVGKANQPSSTTEVEAFVM